MLPPAEGLASFLCTLGALIGVDYIGHQKFVSLLDVITAIVVFTGTTLILQLSFYLIMFRRHSAQCSLPAWGITLKSASHNTQLLDVNLGKCRIKKDILFPSAEHVLHVSSNAVWDLD